jgi:hypothetical protein
VLWKAGGKEGTWTDGGASLGNGMAPCPKPKHAAKGG